MKKILAAICALAVLVGVAVFSIPKAEATENTYQVGYARVDVNPYIDPTLTGDALVATSNIMQLPLRGSGDVWNRLSTKGLMDDDGDGVITSNDGLKATCMAITDANGKTVLLINIDLIGGTLINKVNAAIVERVAAAIASGELENVDLAKEAIYYGGTHTHSAPDSTVYVAAGKTGTNNDGVDLSVVNENLGIWIDRTIENVTEAAVMALKDRAAATVTKDQLAVSDATSEAVEGKTLTMTRHYVNGEDGSVAGDNFNDRGSNPTQVTDADDNIYLMKFSFADSSKLPIILTSFRGHPSLNNSDSYAGADNNCISSDYINAYRKSLEFGVDVTIEKDLGVGYVEDWTYGTTQKYRMIYFNGTGGNTNPRGYEVLRDENGNALTYGTSNTVIRAYTWIDLSASKGGNTRANSVGTVLGVLAQECLNDGKNQSDVRYGEIKTMQKKYTASRKTVGISEFTYNAGVAYQASDALYDAALAAYNTANSKFSTYKTAYNDYANAGILAFLYKSKMESALKEYNTANATLNEKLAAYEEYMTANFTNTATQASTSTVNGNKGPTKPLQTHPMIYKENGETYAIGSRFHASNLVSMWNAKLNIPKTGDTTVTLNAFMLGEDLAFVVVPGEPFDYYFKEYGVYTPENNLWNILNDDSSYGKPIVLGYTNGALGYFPNYEAYFYNEGRTDKSIGSYETQNNTKEAGHGEQMIYEFDSMLATLNATERTAYCEHCKKDVTWTPYLLKTTLNAGHYYMAADYSGAQVRIADNEQVCFDLNGHTFSGVDARAFYLETNTTTTLSIMDSSAGQTGVVKAAGGNVGAPNGYGGKTAFVGKKAVLNLYSGTLTGSDLGTHSVYAGGVLFVRGTFNMYGGTLKGSTVSSFTGQYLKSGVPTDSERTASGGAIESSGTLNLYGGSIISGQAQLITGTVIGSDELGYAYTQTTESIEIADPCVSILAGGVVKLGGDAVVDNLYFADGLSAKFTVEGEYTGAAELTYPESVTLERNTDVGNVKADTAGNAGDVSAADITFTALEGMYAAVKDANLVVAEVPYTYSYCNACQAEVQRKPMADVDFDVYSTVNGSAKTMPAGHYILTENVETVQKQLNGDGLNPGIFCIDLAGHTFTGATRAFYVYDDAVLNIVDSVGGGIVEGKCGSATGGGVLYSQGSAVVNLYAGTVRHNNEVSDTVLNGGCVRINGGTFNMYGGKLEGLNVTDKGGTIYVSARTANSVTTYGSCNIYGGQVTAGYAAAGGDCIYLVNKCTVTLAGDANVADIYFAGAPADALTVDTTKAAFTGSAQLTCATQPAVGATVGTCTGTKGMADGTITIANSEMFVGVESGKLIAKVNVVDPKNVALMVGETVIAGYDTLAEAVADYTFDSTQGNYIKLYTDIAESVTISGETYLNLNGFYVSGTVTVADGAALYCMDSQTDDYTIDDEFAYGMLTKVVCEGTGVVDGIPEASDVAVDGYLKITEKAGMSFHRVNLRITAMSLRASNVGVYYTCGFMGDEIVAENVISYGTVLSVYDIPDAENMQMVCAYTAFDSFNPGAAGNSVNGTLLQGIMKTTNTAEINQRNAELTVYGRAYIETADGYAFGTAVTRSLQELVQDVDTVWSNLTDVQKQGVLDMYETYQSVMTTWEIPNIKAE